MIVAYQPDYIFIHIHRTGGSPLATHLQALSQRKIGGLIQHGNARSDECRLIEDHPDHFTFCFVRNPWERLLSWYSLLHQTNPLPLAEERQRLQLFLPTYEKEIANDPYFHFNQTDYFTKTDGTCLADRCFRFESFATETAELFRILGSDPTDLPQLNRTTPKNYRDYYTDESREFIQRACSKDIDRFGYCF